uniref:Uncharacterized protein n=1 Tax=Pediastrum duplex TaxID=3105 RepID=A0A2U8GIN7_PEDDU|nr:hypothetical protein [Pediastrum duplex]
MRYLQFQIWTWLFAPLCGSEEPKQRSYNLLYLCIGALLSFALSSIPNALCSAKRQRSNNLLFALRAIFFLRSALSSFCAPRYLLFESSFCAPRYLLFALRAIFDSKLQTPNSKLQTSNSNLQKAK